MATLEIIVAVDPAGGFGRQGKIPWKCKEDFAHFARISKEIGVTVMGKRTYLDIREMLGNDRKTLKRIRKKGILRDRTTYVVSSTLDQKDVYGATVVKDLREVLNKYAFTNQRIAVLGGEKLYVEALPFTSVVHITVMDKHRGCDRFFPVNSLAKHFTIDRTQSKIVETEVDGSLETVRFVRYERPSINL